MNPGTAVAEPWFHLLPGPEPAVFLTGRSMLFDIDQDFLGALTRAEPDALAELRGLAAPTPNEPATLAPIAALSLNIARRATWPAPTAMPTKGASGGGRG